MSRDDLDSHVEQLSVTTWEDSRAVVLVPDGELDMLSSQEVWSLAERTLRRADNRLVVLDLTAVSFLDSHGIGTLVRVTESANRLGLRLRLVVLPTQQASRSIELCGVRHMIDTYESVEQAVWD
jgi:anti-sigma B factor antagonist